MTHPVRISQVSMVAGVFIWVGMVVGISFLESWLKFQAPGITIDHFWNKINSLNL